MLRFILGRAGSGKTYTVFKTIEKMLSEKKENIILLVPEQFTFECEKQLLKNCGAFASRVDVVGFTQLCENIFNELGGGAGKYVDDSIRHILMGQAVKSVCDDLKVYAKYCESSEFIGQMVAAVTELKQAAVDADTLLVFNEKLDNNILNNKLRDIAYIMRAYDALLTEKFIDPLDYISLACEKIRNNNWFSGKTVIIDSFTGFTAAQNTILKEIIKNCTDTYISFCYDWENETDDDYSIFANVRREINIIKNMCKDMQVEIGSPVLLKKRYTDDALLKLDDLVSRNSVFKYEAESEAITICCADSLYNEAEFVARSIKRLVREKSYRFRDFSVISGAADSYNRVLSLVFKKHGIPFFCDTRVKVKHLPLFVMLSYLLKAAIYINTEDILNYLKSGLTQLSNQEVDWISNYVFVWNINGLDWLSDWTMNPDGLVDSKAAFDDRLAALNKIRKIAVDPIVRLREIGTASIGELVASIYKILCDIGVKKQLKDYADALKSEGENLSSSLQFAAWDCLVSVFDKISFSLSDSKITIKEFFSIFDNCAQTETISSIPQGIDEVVIGNADRVRTGYVKINFLVGVNQGVFPAVNLNEGLLSAADREKLISLGAKIPDRYINDLIEEKLRFYNACCTATHQVFVCYSQTDLQLSPLEPSRIVDKITNSFPCCKIHNESFGCKPTPESIESVYSAFEKAAAYWTDENEVVAAIKECFKDRDEFKRLIKAAEQLQKGTKIAIQPDNALKLFGKDIKLSASKIDTYFHCKFQYFCRYGLGARLLQKADMNALVRGTLVHHLLEKVLSKHKADVESLTAEVIAEEVDAFTDLYFNELKLDIKQLGVVFGYMLNSLKQLVINLIERISAEFSQSEFKISDCELKIGDSQDVKSLKIELSDGGSVSVNGVIDRVDVADYNEKKYVRIVDYKTGKKTIAVSDLLLGLNLQMMIYLYAIVKNGKGKYGESVGCGVLYMPAKSTDDESESKLRMSGLLIDDVEVLRLMERDLKNQYIPFALKKDNTPNKYSKAVSEEVFKSIYSHIDKLLLMMGDGIHNGDFDIDPVDSSDVPACRYCDFYSVCRKEKHHNKKSPSISDSQAGEILLSGKEGEKWA